MLLSSPLRTNVKQLDPDEYFWIDEFHGAALAAAAHAFSRRFTSMFIASTYDIAGLQPLGSHPLLDPNYSSAALTIRHDGITLSRLDKVRFIADWECALRNLDVCVGQKVPGAVNCGSCRKCLLTLLELLVVDKLDVCSSFAANSVSVSMLRNIKIENDFGKRCYLELIEPLMIRGRGDLASVIRDRVRAYEHTQAWRCSQGWRGALRRLEGGVLDGIVPVVREFDLTGSPVKAARMMLRILRSQRPPDFR